MAIIKPSSTGYAELWPFDTVTLGITPASVSTPLDDMALTLIAATSDSNGAGILASSVNGVGLGRVNLPGTGSITLVTCFLDPGTTPASGLGESLLELTTDLGQDLGLLFRGTDGNYHMDMGGPGSDAVSPMSAGLKMVVGVYDSTLPTGSNVLLYVNGVLTGTGSSTLVPRRTQSVYTPVYIGRLAGDTVYSMLSPFYFAGLVASAWDASTVLANYNALFPAPPSSSSSSSSSSSGVSSSSSSSSLVSSSSSSSSKSSSSSSSSPAAVVSKQNYPMLVANQFFTFPTFLLNADNEPIGPPRWAEGAR